MKKIELSAYRTFLYQQNIRGIYYRESILKCEVTWITIMEIYVTVEDVME